MPAAAARSETANETMLRRSLWKHHGCPESAQYGENGDMQCLAPGCRLDFKADPLAHIVLKLFDNGRLQVVAAKPT